MALTLGQSVVGLAIRPDAVEVVQLSAGLRGFRLVQATRVPLEASAATGMSSERMSAAIRAAFEQVQGRPKRVVVALPPHDVLLRSFTIPEVPKAEVANAVQFEARKYIPFKMSELVWDYTVVSSRADAREKLIRIVVGAIERATLLGLQGWLQRAGVEAGVVEPQSLSLARAVKLSRQAPEHDVVALVDVAGTDAQITLARGGLPYLTREVRSEPGRQGGAGEAGGGQQLNQVLGELRLTMDFFTHEIPGAAIRRVLVFGDQAAVAGWPAQLTAQLSCPVELGRMPIAGASNQPMASPAFAVAAAAAAAGRGRAGTLLNFLKPGQVQAPTGRQAAAVSGVGGARQWFAALHRPSLAVCGALAAGCLIALWVFGSHRVAQARQGLEKTRAAAPAVSAAIAGKTTADLEPLQQEAEQKLQFLRGLMDHRPSLAAKFDALARSMPEGVWLTGLDYESRVGATPGALTTLTLRGACYRGESAEEIAAVQRFGSAMKENPTFFDGFRSGQLRKITVQSTAQGRYTYRTFELAYSSEQTVQ